MMNVIDSDGAITREFVTFIKLFLLRFYIYKILIE